MPERLLSLSIDEIKELEKKVALKYGFKTEEVKFVMKHKPSFLFSEEEGETGMRTLENYFVKKYGYDYELVKTLVVKYPYILSKTEEQLDLTFSVLAEHGVTRAEAMKLVFECPKLLSMNLEARIKEITFLFDLYHGIQKDRVFEIFRAWPYLFCISTDKLPLFLGQFKKYRFTND